ncbi:hypothetical protein [Streptomyces chartreusis]|uniref:Uncharacterized protein n=1 Tax=Streptomyces chartreusis TaxID=1969 RepID=A0A7H8TB95_STRCX|nr:hypothetical protein [Streptomyces chartreusis]QKZ20268.1 hypothetical protein HUT05_24690 [Streptomyces chartreusis]
MPRFQVRGAAQTMWTDETLHVDANVSARSAGHALTKVAEHVEAEHEGFYFHDERATVEQVEGRR